MKRQINIISGIAIFLTLLISLETFAQDGATLFKPCAACHSIGKGRMVGPDLKDITKRRQKNWLVKFIQSPSKLFSSGDKEANLLLAEYNNVPMPDNSLTVDQVNQILIYIAGDSAMIGESDTSDNLAEQKLIDSILKTNSPFDILKGYNLFNGISRFSAGGTACATCHNATFESISNGGTIAMDLTNAYKRLGGFDGIKGIIAAPPYPSMNEAYKNNIITGEETAFLQLFLKNTDLQNPAGPKKSIDLLLFGGLALVCLLAVAIALIWYRRKRGSVNKQILKRQKRYSI